MCKKQHEPRQHNPRSHESHDDHESDREFACTSNEDLAGVLKKNARDVCHTKFASETSVMCKPTDCGKYDKLRARISKTEAEKEPEEPKKK